MTVPDITRALRDADLVADVTPEEETRMFGAPAPQPPAAPWVRTRFRADPDDWRPITWPPPGPCWCTGYGEGYSVVVAYHPVGTDVRTWWPEASEIDPEDAPGGPEFTDRFPRPDWWKDAQ